jgi:NTP pyrophosphatase (non-canonical NTP hydrolase)
MHSFLLKQNPFLRGEVMTQVVLDIVPFMNEYQRGTLQTDQGTFQGMDGLRLPLLGLYGEVGSLLSALKKKRRDHDAYIGYQDSILEEFGDVLWYFSNIAARAGLDLSVLGQKVARGIVDWDETEPYEAATFCDVTPHSEKTHDSQGAGFEQTLFELAGKVGRLLEDVAQGRIEHNRDALAAHLVEIFRALVLAANQADVDLDEAARRNILKTQSRWPSQRIFTPLFDESDDQEEQLPRLIVMNVLERKSGSKSYVRLKCNDINIGDRLTDNKADEDDYRFHDVFHLAYAAILGWSPVVRALFKVKRKSRPHMDENQDGARAVLIEEGISTWIFNHATRLNYFEGIASLDYPLLKAIGQQVSGYEVQQCPLWMWEKAILDGYEVFRNLRKHRGGVITADMVERRIHFTPIV